MISLWVADILEGACSSAGWMELNWGVFPFSTFPIELFHHILLNFSLSLGPRAEEVSHLGFLMVCESAQGVNNHDTTSTWLWCSVPLPARITGQRHWASCSTQGGGWGVPAVAQGDQQRLCSARRKVWSPAQHIGLKDPTRRSQLCLRSDPWLRDCICLRVAKTTKKKNGVRRWMLVCWLKNNASGQSLIATQQHEVLVSISHILIFSWGIHQFSCCYCFQTVWMHSGSWV